MSLGMWTLVAMLGAATPPHVAPDTVLEEGDAHYARRAEGARGALASSTEIEAALADYRRALKTTPDAPDVRWRLVRALYFRAMFCGAEAAAKTRWLDEARLVGEEGLTRLARGLGKPAEGTRLHALRVTPGALELHYWSAVAWGEWALAHGQWAAAREGVAGRVRELAQTVIEGDPLLENGGGWRVIGRLHAVAPRIPLITDWVSRGRGLQALRLALALGPQQVATKVFLAEAILQYDRGRRKEALGLLDEAVQTPARPEYAVEDAYFAERARELLAGERPRT